jgi:hypothetical protein
MCFDLLADIKFRMETFNYPFNHTMMLHSHTELNHDSALALLVSSADLAHCLFIETAAGEHFLFWNLGAKDDDANYEFSILKRKMLCLHVDVILDSLKSDYKIHLISLSDKPGDSIMTHAVFSANEPLTTYFHSVYHFIDTNTNNNQQTQEGCTLM